MKNIIDNRTKSVSIYLKDIKLEDFATLMLLSIFLVVLIASSFKVIISARNNYDIFNVELKGLEEIRAKNEELKRELAYVTSDEYKLLYLRDSSALGKPEEQLYSIKEDLFKAEEKIEYYDISEKVDYTDWWVSLLIL